MSTEESDRDHRLSRRSCRPARGRPQFAHHVIGGFARRGLKRPRIFFQGIARVRAQDDAAVINLTVSLVPFTRPVHRAHFRAKDLAAFLRQ